MGFEKYFLVAIILISLISCKCAMNMQNMQSNSKIIEQIKQSWINGKDFANCAPCDQCSYRILDSYEFSQCSNKTIYKLPHFKPENISCCTLFHINKCARNLVKPVCNQLSENDTQIVYDRFNTSSNKLCKNISQDQLSKVCDVDTGDDLTFDAYNCIEKVHRSYRFNDCLTNNTNHYPNGTSDYRKCCDNWSFFECWKPFLKPICHPPENEIDKVTSLIYESINYLTKSFQICNGTVEESYKKCQLKYNNSHNIYITWFIPFQIIILFVFYSLNFKL